MHWPHPWGPPTCCLTFTAPEAIDVTHLNLNLSRRLVAVAALGALALTGCTSSEPEPEPSAAPQESPSEDETPSEAPPGDVVDETSDEERVFDQDAGAPHQAGHSYLEAIVFAEYNAAYAQLCSEATSVMSEAEFTDAVEEARGDGLPLVGFRTVEGETDAEGNFTAAVNLRDTPEEESFVRGRATLEDGEFKLCALSGDGFDLPAELWPADLPTDTTARPEPDTPPTDNPADFAPEDGGEAEGGNTESDAEADTGEEAGDESPAAEPSPDETPDTADGS